MRPAWASVEYTDADSAGVTVSRSEPSWFGAEHPASPCPPTDPVRLPCYPAARMTRRPPPPGRGSAPRRGARGNDPRRRPGSTAAPRIILIAFGLAAIALFIGILSAYATYTSDLPDVAEIENFDLAQGSTVVSADGIELATFAIEDRREIAFEDIPQVMVDAQVAAEDQSFWNNPCVDFRSIVRAFLQNFQAGETVSGASTICQQLVRMRLFSADLLADPEPPGRAEDQGGDPRPASRRPLRRRRGQAAHPRDVHEPVLLREQRVRDLGRRQRLLRQGPHLRRPRGPAHRQRGGDAGRPGARALTPRPDDRGRPGGASTARPSTWSRRRHRRSSCATSCSTRCSRSDFITQAAVRRGGRRGDRPRPARGTTRTGRRTSSTPCDARRTSCSRERTCSTPAV